MKPRGNYLALSLLLAAIAVCGCDAVEVPQAQAGADADCQLASIANDPTFHPQLLSIARDYLSYSLVDQQVDWAPAECAAPSGPAQPEFSKSDAGAPHGGKLYYLFAKDLRSYWHAAQHESPVGQAIVKESWRPQPVEAAARRSYLDHPSGNQVDPYTARDGQSYHAGERGELFVIYKLDPATPGTDRGWVYGTLTADGARVTSAGRVQSCLECHQSAGVDRLFGPKNPPPPTPAGSFPGEIPPAGDYPHLPPGR